MALIAMAVHDTEENGRAEMTERVLVETMANVDHTRHRLIIIDNDSCAESKRVMRMASEWFGADVITNNTNFGTAEAINKAWVLARPDEYVIKIDNDCAIGHGGWADEMEEAMRRAPHIGILGLKRKDLWECPWHQEERFRSTLEMLPHEAGQRWVVVEYVNHVMGTCQMYSPELRAKIGYLCQPRLYGFDDSLAAIRCHVAGYKNAFLPHIEIDHIDPGGTAYQDWKHRVSGEDMAEYNRLKHGYQTGQIPIYYNPFK